MAGLSASADTWIGLDDEALEGSMVWLDGSAYSPDAYTSWDLDKAEPDDSASAAEGSADCVVLAVSAAGKWRTEACDQPKAFLCSKR